MKSMFAIIPARGGSKRLPGKNLKLLDGVSLLERTIRQAKKIFPYVVVSTDSAEIMKEAVRCGASALLRPDRLATDEATSAEVVDHVIATYPRFDWFCLLQVTSPLRTEKDIWHCVNLALQCDKPVVSVFEGKPNGAVYIGKTLSFSGDFFSNAMLYEMPEERSVDIDTIEDFEKAESLLHSLDEQIRFSSVQ